MVARPLVGWAFSSSRPAKIGWASDLDANGAGSLTLWLIQSFSGRKAHQAAMRIGSPIAIQIHFLRRNPTSFSFQLVRPRGDLELLQRCGAEVRVEAFAIDRYSVVLIQVCTSWNFVILVAFVSLQL